MHVDDDPSLREIAKLMLRDLDCRFEIDQACCVDEAFKKLAIGKYDVVVADYEMPQKNGLEFLKELREQNNKIPFILFTGKGREEVAVKALNLGADRYLDKNGSPEAIYNELAHAINIIVERKKSAQLLAESNSKYRMLVEQSLQGIMIAQNGPLRIVFANAAMGIMLGYKPEEFTSFSPAEVVGLVLPEDRHVFFSRIKSRFEGIVYDSNFEFRAVRRDGSIVWMEAFVSEIEYNGQPAAQTMFLDIDERKKKEETIKKSEARYRDLANFLPEIVFETDLSGKITFFSQNGFEISGFTPEDIEKGLNMLQFVVPKDRERAKENIRRRIAGEKSDSNEYVLLKRNGDIYPAIVKTAPIYSENKIIGLRGLVIDIAERNKAERILMESEERFKKLVTNNQDVIMLTQADGVILYLSPACKNVLGYEPTELIGKVPWIIHPDDLERVQRVFQSALSSKVSENLEYRILTKQGETKWINHAFSQIWENDILKQIVSNLTDISERKKAEEAMVQSESHYRLLADNIRDVIWTMDLEGHFTYVSPSALQLSGYAPDEAIKQSIVEVLTPESARKVLEDLQSFRETGTLPSNYYELEEYCKDGSTVWIEVNFTVLRNRNGEPESFLGVSRDITDRKRAEDNIKSLAKFPNENPSAVLRIDKNGKLLFANFQSQKILDSLKLKIGQPFPERWRKTIIEALESKNQLFLEENANERIFSFSLVPVVFEGYVNVYGSDITERKKAEMELLNSEAKLRAILDATPFPVALVDTNDDKIMFWSSSALKLFGHIASTTKEWYEIAYPNLVYRQYVINQWKPALEKARLKGQWVNTGEYNVTCHDGSVRICELYATFLEDMLIVTFNDITAHKKAEQALVEANNKNQSYLDIADVMIVAISPNQNTVLANKKTLEILGYSEDEILNKNWFDAVIPEADKPSATKTLNDILSGKIEQYKYVENEILTKNGELRLIAWHNSVLKNKEGSIVASLSSGQDITDQKKTESELKIEKDALRESEAKLRSIVENSSDQIFMLDKNLRYLTVNKTLADTLGKTPEETIGKSIKEVYTQETASKFSNNIKNVFETGKSIFTEEKMVAQGHELYISTSLNPIQDDTGNTIAVAGIVRDITENKKAEEESKFRADLLNHVGQAVIMVDNNRIIRFWNKAAEKLYGYSEEQALGHQINELLGNPPREETEKVTSKLMAGESWSTETLVKNRDGSIVPVILNRTPLFKEDGEFSGAASITTDITLQKNTEADLTFSLESLSYSLAKIQELNEKLRVIGGLTRHDVRNKLSAVTGYAYLLKKKHADEADVVEGLGKMEQAVKDSMKIFEFAKMYEQLGVEELTNIDVETKITEAAALFSGTLPKIINKCQGLTVLADSFLRQMFYNFVDNTIKYGQKTSTIKVSYKETDQNNLVLTYEDDGVGISAENKSKIFL